jgi:YVTN family beta-propeller protein
VPADLRTGSELLGFRIERVLGRGGMGVVYLAHQVVLDRMVALKLLAPELASDEQFRERFLRESRLAASLDHPSIVPVFDAGETGGRLYIAMRYVEGTDLRRLLDREGPLAPERALRLLAPVADALDTAHAKGLVHRDVKPSNILIDQQDRPYLADFGLTKHASEHGLVESSHFAASLDYVAPEQIERQPVGPAADVYALACVLHECLTGNPPFRRPSPLATLFAHLNDPPPPTGSPLDPVLAKALAKQPDQRHTTSTQLIAAARKALGLPDVVVVHDRKPLLLAMAGVVLVAVALAAFLLTREDGPAKPSTKPTLTPKVDSLQRIDPTTNKLAATIGVDQNPDTVAVGAGRVWVGSVEDQSVLRIDPKTNEVTDRVTTVGPHSIAATAEDVFVANSDGTLTRIDPSTLDISNAPNPGSRGVAVGEGAIWTIGSQGLVHVNREGVVVRAVSPVGFSPFAVATGGGAVWVLDDKLRSLWRVDPRTDHVVKRIRLGFDPGGLAFGRGRIWVTNNGGDAVAEIDPATDRVLRSIPVGDGPIGVTVGEGSVWTANYRDGTVSRIDPRRGRVIATVAAGRKARSIAVGEGAVWVPVRAT